MLLERGCAGCRSDLTRTLRSRVLPAVCLPCADRLAAAPSLSVPGVDAVLAVWTYDSALAPIIGSLKRGGRPGVAKDLGGALAVVVRPFLQKRAQITWVPASSRGRRRRGFDQGRLLAESLGGCLDVPTRPALTRSGRAQFGGNRRQRLQGPRLRVRPDWVRLAPTDQVILVDDVITTGASMAAAAKCIRAAHPSVDLIAAAIALKP